MSARRSSEARWDSATSACSCRSGAGTTRDDKRAFTLFQAAAEQEYPRAQFFLGLSYEAGRGVEKDEEKAAQMYALAAEQEYPDASARWASAMSTASASNRT